MQNAPMQRSTLKPGLCYAMINAENMYSHEAKHFYHIVKFSFKTIKEWVFLYDKQS